MKNYILLLIIFCATITTASSQVKVSGGGGMGLPPIPTDPIVEQKFNAFEVADKLTVNMIHVAPTDLEAKAIAVSKVSAKTKRDLVLISVSEFKQDLTISAMGNQSLIFVPCRLDNYKEYSAAQFSSNVLKLNSEISLFLVCKKALLKNSTIQELLSSEENFDLNAIREKIDKAGLGGENIIVVYSKITRDE